MTSDSRPATDPQRVKLTLGTSGGMNLNGKLVEDAVRIMKAYGGVDKRHCRGCKKKMRAVISAIACEERASNPNDSLTRCDDCWKSGGPDRSV